MKIEVVTYSLDNDKKDIKFIEIPSEDLRTKGFFIYAFYSKFYATPIFRSIIHGKRDAGFDTLEIKTHYYEIKSGLKLKPDPPPYGVCFVINTKIVTNEDLFQRRIQGIALRRQLMQMKENKIEHIDELDFINYLNKNLDAN